MRYLPRVYQHMIRDYGLHHYRANIWAGMGLGKTVATLDIYDTLRAFGYVRRLLVIGPKRVSKLAWPAELAKWRESFPHLSMAVAIGTADERKAALRQQADITTVNYEMLPWLCEGYGDRWPFDMVVADESTRLKGLRIAQLTSSLGNEYTRGQGSSRAKAIHRIAFKNVRHWINLTGSPAPNGLVDLWGQQYFVDAGRRLGTSFSGFEKRWFRSIPNADGYHQIEPLAFAQAEIESALKDCSISIDAKDYFDIKDPIESNVYVDLPPKARRNYETMQAELFAELASGDRIDVFAAGAKAQKCLQIANGTVYTEPGVWQPVHDEKIEALRSVLDEANGDPVLIRYTHVPDKERILNLFGRRVRFFDDKQSTIDAWNRGEIPGLVTHAASTGHGLSLQDGGRILCDYGSDFNLEHDEQIIERIGPTRQLQSGHNRSVFRRRIIARDTIEELSVLPRLRFKMGVQESLKLAMRTRQ